MDSVTDWAQRLAELGRLSGGPGEALAQMRLEQPDIAAQPFNVALAARDAFGLTVVQLHEVRAWLEGLRTDDELIQVLDPSSS